MSLSTVAAKNRTKLYHRKQYHKRKAAELQAASTNTLFLKNIFNSRIRSFPR